MCGLPASGKTTLAAQLHRRLGGTLIRQCDVYARLGIDLRAWVRRTEGFSREVDAYERVRDAAYADMLRQLHAALARESAAVIVDAVHGEAAKRRALYEACATYGRAAVAVWCRCDDADEVRRRFSARAGLDTPEHEADDLSVYRHILSLWEPPTGDRLPDGSPVAVAVYDSVRGAWAEGQAGLSARGRQSGS
jgi:predicted kinase